MKSGIELKNKSDTNSKYTEKIGSLILKNTISSDLLCETRIGEDENTSKLYCVKLLKNEYHSNISIVKKFLSSPHEIYARIGNKELFANIIKAEKKISQDKVYVYLIQEIVEGLPLGQWYKQSTLTVEEKKEVAKKICEAIRQLHCQKIMHLGLSMESIIVNTPGKIKISDYCTTYPHIFGKVDENRSINKLKCASPELFTGIDVSSFSPSHDIYSLGIIFQELIFGKNVTNVNNYSEMKRVICSGNLSGIDPFLLTAVNIDPSKRYNRIEELRDIIDKIGTSSPILEKKTSTTNRKTSNSASSKNTTSDVSLEEYIKELLNDYCKTKYVSNERHEQIYLLVCDRFSTHKKEDIKWKIHTIIKQLKMFDETLRRKDLKQNIRISAKKNKISKSNYNRIINEAVNMGMEKMAAEIAAKEELNEDNIRLTFF